MGLVYGLPVASAQVPSDEAVTYTSADGQSMIVSQRVTLTADALSKTGQADQVTITPTGLTLAEGVTTGVYTSGAVRSPLNYTTDIGLTWLADVAGDNKDQAIKVEARLSENGTTWQEWFAVPAEYNSDKYAGQLIWIDQTVTYLQFRLTWQANPNNQIKRPVLRSFEITFSDARQGPTAEMAAQTSEVLQTSEVAAMTCPPKPPIISRIAWGAPTGPFSPNWPPTYAPLTHLVINHTATSNTPTDWASVVRSIWNYHANTLGWGDIGYQYLLDPQGRIYEGRAGGDDVVGAFDGFNWGALGLGYLGCYGNCNYLGLYNVAPSAAMLQAGNALMAWKMGQKGLNPFGNGYYCEQNLPNIVARSAIVCRGPSLSPGDWLEAEIPNMRQAVAQRIQACRNTLPTATPTLPRPTMIPTILPPTTTPPPIFPTATPSPWPTNPPNPTATPLNFPTATPTPTGRPTVPAGSAIQVQPTVLAIAPNQTATTTVELVGLSNIFAFDIQLTYDANIVEVVDVDGAKAGVQIAPGSLLAGKDVFIAQNEATQGSIKFAGTLIAPATPLSGNGSLLVITWWAKNVGQTDLNLTKAILVDTRNQLLTADLRNGQIRVGASVALTGQAQRQGRNDAQGIIVSAGDQQTETAADGRFTVKTNGIYHLTFTAPGYLSAVLEGEIPSSAASSGLADVGSIILFSGDVTHDNKVDIFDLALLGSRYGNADPSIDLNGDGAINIFDLAIAAGNYGKQGAAR